MNDQSRTTNVIRNSLAGIAVQGGTIVLNFCVRLVFVRYLSQEYLGINGLFTNILTILALAELGVGNAITYSLYKPVAAANHLVIAALLNFYRKAYFTIGFVIAVLGLGLIPFLPVLVSEYSSIPNLTLIYVLYLANTVASYFFAHKRSIFIADQRERTLSKCRFLFTALKSIGQCIVLFLVQDFLIFLSVQIICTFVENLFILFLSRRVYPFLSKYRDASLSKSEVSEIATNIRSLMIYKVGNTVLDGTDNIILSVYVGLSWIGKLSNYTLISASVSMVISQIMSALTASVGNYIATEDSDRYEDLLNKILFVSFVFYGFSFVCLSCLSTPFVRLVFGPEYTLNFSAVFVLSLNFYIFGMMNAIWTFRSTMGLFVHGKYRPLISAIINIVVSVSLAKLIGPIGVLLGTTITRTVTNVWFDPYIVYRYGLGKPPYRYYLVWLKYLAIAISATFMLQVLFSHFFLVSNIYIFLVQCFLCIILFGLLFIVVLFRTKEFQYCLRFGKQFLSTLHKR